MLKLSNQIINNSSHVAFKGWFIERNNYASSDDNLEISNKTVTRATATNGNIKLNNARVLNDVESINGNINSDYSVINGRLLNKNGNVKLRNSHVGANVTVKNGNIKLEQSDINGDVNSLNGNIKIADSKVKGQITSRVDGLKLSGNNELNKVVLKNANNGMGIIYSNGNTVSISGFSQVIIVNGKVINGTGMNVSEKAPEFIVPSGTKIQELIFESKKAGIALLEDGAQIVGKIINGTIKHIKR